MSVSKFFSHDFTNSILWDIHKNFYLSKAPQRSPEWHSLRQYRLTASNFAAAAGMGAYSSDEEIYHQKVHNITPDISDYSKKLMDHGTRMEDTARIWYENKTNHKVEEYGLVVPKWDLRIGASVDGVILDSDGIIEIKCPMKLYPDLKNFSEAKLMAWKPSTHYNNHIKIDHYCQMIGCMAILGKKWCDYVVYPSNGDGHIYRVYFNAEFWESFLYPKLNNFMNRVEDGLNKKE